LLQQYRYIASQALIYFYRNDIAATTFIVPQQIQPLRSVTAEDRPLLTPNQKIGADVESRDAQRAEKEGNTTAYFALFERHLNEFTSSNSLPANLSSCFSERLAGT
jgi:hypothetical protein